MSLRLCSRPAARCILPERSDAVHSPLCAAFGSSRRSAPSGGVERSPGLSWPVAIWSSAPPVATGGCRSASSSPRPIVPGERFATIRAACLWRKEPGGEDGSRIWHGWCTAFARCRAFRILRRIYRFLLRLGPWSMVHLQSLVNGCTVEIGQSPFATAWCSDP